MILINSFTPVWFACLIAQSLTSPITETGSVTVPTLQEWIINADGSRSPYVAPLPEQIAQSIQLESPFQNLARSESRALAARDTTFDCYGTGSPIASYGSNSWCSQLCHQNSTGWVVKAASELVVGLTGIDVNVSSVIYHGAGVLVQRIVNNAVNDIFVSSDTCNTSCVDMMQSCNFYGGILTINLSSGQILLQYDPGSTCGGDANQPIAYPTCSV